VKPVALVCVLAMVVMRLMMPSAPPERPRTKPPYVYLPLAGTPLLDGALEGTHCLALLPEIVRHPHWSLSLRETEWTVMDGVIPRATMTIRDTGEVWYGRDVAWEAGMRSFFLTAEELRAIRGLDRRSCRPRAAAHDHARTFYVTYGAPIGDDDLVHAAPISVDSDMGEVLDRIVRAANARYIVARARDARPLELELRVPRGRQGYRLRVVDGLLTLTRDGVELYRHPLSPEELVDLADWNLSPRLEDDHVSEYGWARGVLVADFTHSLLFDSADLPLAFPHFGAELTRVIDADCDARGCLNGVSVSQGQQHLIPP
jgi:hypothetical protein